MDVSDVLSGASVSTVSASMRFFLRLRHNAFSYSGLQTFRLRSHSIVASQWDRNSAFAVHAVRYYACFQSSYESDV